MSTMPKRAKRQYRRKCPRATSSVGCTRVSVRKPVRTEPRGSASNVHTIFTWSGSA